MKGKKEQSFAPLVNVSLEELVPQDHFYRYLERTFPRGAQRDVHLKRSGSRPFFIVSMASAPKRNFYNIL